VEGEEQTRDVIVLPDRVLTNWRRADGHRLVLADLGDVIDELPERLIVGTGRTAGCVQSQKRCASSGREASKSTLYRPTKQSVATANSIRAAPRLHCTLTS
jgi:hypothetical protein